ncbi:hypothetical protein ZYGR_0AI03370 [Zygosaccharomyces rouxii]|uniref:Cyclin n=1 Tax=Zygosaccharomyces rouxii TaxID=4956 RepID=A0A1Q3ABR5_ZYGRO|nr:hypothetical protein ZYGR_0AI03370 [Zygosaccharomyces rouxii]
MYSSVPNGTTTESLRSCSLRDNNEEGRKDNEGTVQPLSVGRSGQNDIQNDIGLSRVVTTEHTMSSSSQSSLSRHESHNSMEYTPLRSGQSGEDETVVNSEQVEGGSVTTGTASSSPVRQREKEEERRAHEKVSWRQSQAGGPTLRDVSPQRQREQGQEQEHEEQEQEERTSFEKLESLDIAEFPTDKLLEMLTALLDKIVKSNDKLMDTSFFHQQQQENGSAAENCLRSVLSFRGKHIPQISLEHYFQRIQKYCPTSNDVFLSLLVYFDRISRKCNSSSHHHHDGASTDTNGDSNYGNGHDNVKNQGHNNQPSTPAPQQQFVMDSHNIHRLIIAGTTVSTKFFSDFFYSNSRYARVGGISLQELNYLELQFLVLCDFELLISVNELQRYADLLYRFWNKSKPHPSE